MSVDEEGQMSSETVQVDLMTTKLATMNDILAAVEVDPKVGVDLLMTPSSREKKSNSCWECGAIRNFKRQCLPARKDPK